MWKSQGHERIDELFLGICRIHSTLILPLCK